MSALFAGLKVIEVATFVFAPGAGTAMADFGAEVIHVEPPGIGDPLRMLYQLRPLPECEDNYCWLLESRNKKSLVLDLKQADGHAVLMDLMKTADVLITNYQPSVLADLRITYEQVRSVNPRLIYAHATGYGETGAEVEKPGYDATAWWARSGMMDAVRPGGAELALATAAMGDHPSSVSLLAGISMALYARERSGKGTKVSSSLAANGVWANSVSVQAALCGGTRFPAGTQSTAANAMLNHYRCADDRSFYLVLIKEAQEFPQFCAAIGRPELATDPRFAEVPERRQNSVALIKILNEVFGSEPLAHWREVLDRHKITFGIVQTAEEVAVDEQLHANGVFSEFANAPGQKVVNHPVNLEDYPKVAPRLPPEPGQHNSEILRGLGYDDEHVAALAQAGILGASGGS